MSERQVVRTWNVLSTLYPVVRMKLEDGDEGEYQDGECRVSETVPPHKFWSVEGHELGHAIADEIGLKRTLTDVFGLSVEVADKIEEEIVAKFLHVCLDTLERAKCLTPPKAPRMAVAK